MANLTPGLKKGLIANGSSAPTAGTDWQIVKNGVTVATNDVPNGWNLETGLAIEVTVPAGAVISNYFVGFDASTAYVNNRTSVENVSFASAFFAVSSTPSASDFHVESGNSASLSIAQGTTRTVSANFYGSAAPNPSNSDMTGLTSWRVCRLSDGTYFDNSGTTGGWNVNKGFGLWVTSPANAADGNYEVRYLDKVFSYSEPWGDTNRSATFTVGAVATASYTVSGGGNNARNGIYTELGTHNNLPTYSNGSGSFLYRDLIENLNFWFLSSVVGHSIYSPGTTVDYYFQSDSSTPPVGSNVWDVWSDAMPGPTVMLTPSGGGGVTEPSCTHNFLVADGTTGNYTLNGGASFTLGITAATLQANQRALGGVFTNVTVTGTSTAASNGTGAGYTVSGAGTSAFNGNYAYNGIIGGKDSWRLDDDHYIFFAPPPNGYNGWIIGSLGNNAPNPSIYYNSSTLDAPPLTDWNFINAGPGTTANSPVPTLSVFSGSGNVTGSASFIVSFPEGVTVPEPTATGTGASVTKDCGGVSGTPGNPGVTDPLTILRPNSTTIIIPGKPLPVNTSHLRLENRKPNGTGPYSIVADNIPGNTNVTVTVILNSMYGFRWVAVGGSAGEGERHTVVGSGTTFTIYGDIVVNTATSTLSSVQAAIRAKTGRSSAVVSGTITAPSTPVAQASSDFVVSGAGSTETNGTYVPFGTYEGKPMYHLSNGIYTFLIAFLGGEWVITNESEGIPAPAQPFYYNPSTAATPPFTGWTNEYGQGAAPAPTVAVGGTIPGSSNLTIQYSPAAGNVGDIEAVPGTGYVGTTYPAV